MTLGQLTEHFALHAAIEEYNKIWWTMYSMFDVHRNRESDLHAANQFETRLLGSIPDPPISEHNRSLHGILFLDGFPDDRHTTNYQPDRYFRRVGRTDPIQNGGWCIDWMEQGVYDTAGWALPDCHRRQKKLGWDNVEWYLARWHIGSTLWKIRLVLLDVNVFFYVMIFEQKSRTHLGLSGILYYYIYNTIQFLLWIVSLSTETSLRWNFISFIDSSTIIIINNNFKFRSKMSW